MKGPPPLLEEIGKPIAGRYEVEEVLGRGGMGAVYCVRDRKTGKKIALKRGWSIDANKARKRQALLEREYHTLAQLAHPRIIEVHEFGIDARGPYYTMELLDGADLDQTGRLPWKEACAVLHDVASSLAILHSRGLLHRDVSPRNVRRTADGRAKLIDFGAMTSMGVSKQVVGTPPFLAPEVLQMQALDARADLFSLGALGYYLLTGRHAFPARKLSELRDVWRSTPAAPSRWVPEIPVALNALIVQLLSLDRTTRPRTAAEVMQRLCAIAGLPTEEHARVQLAYLTTPTLVGRDKALLAVRKRMLSLVRGDGGTLLIEGVSGSGRSRVLDACALEGKLVGATVVRVDASDAASGEWGAARALCAQLFELLPKEATEAGRLSHHVLGQVIEGMRDETSASLSVTVPERSLLIRELRDFVLSVARAQRLLFVIDDADRIDEPSAALIAALAHKTERHALALALAIDKESKHAASAALRVLRSIGDLVPIEQLGPEETETLMRSVFGEIANLPLVSGRIHALAQGNVRAAMELAQHLVDRGLARYDAGSWSLPAELDEGDLPLTLSASLAARLGALTQDARELAEVLSLADGDALTLASYPALTSHRDPKRVFRALDELVAARVLSADVERYTFSQRGFLPVLQERMGGAQRALVHGRLANLLASGGGDVVRRAHHLLEADRDREAVELLMSINLLVRLPPLPLLETAVERAERHGLPQRTIHQLRMALLSKAALVMAAESFKRCVPSVLAQLEQDSGLLLYRELADRPGSERLAQALARTQQRYFALPEEQRVYPVVEAVRELGRLSGAFCSMASTVGDLALLESLPSLEPLLPLSPALSVVEDIVEASKEFLRGRLLRNTSIYERVLARISEPDRAGLDDAQHARTRLGIHGNLGMFKASFGSAGAEQHARALEGDRELRVNAWRVRMLMHLGQGNSEEAHKCARRAELLQLQEGLEERYTGATAGYELVAHSLAGDLLGVKSALDGVELLAERHPGWLPMLHYGQGRYRQLQGDGSGALEAVERGLTLARPNRHGFFAYLAGAHVELLMELGRFDEARERGREYLEVCEQAELVTTSDHIYTATAQAHARAGDGVEALRIMGTAIERGEKLGKEGLALGTLYEARARVAAFMGDRSAFDHFAGLCADEYAKGKNPLLSARFARLIEEARHQELGPIESSKEMSQLIAAESQVRYETIYSRMHECVDTSDRARCALTLLLQNLDSFTGYLFGVRADGISLLAGLPETLPDDELFDWATSHLYAEIEADAEMTATQDREEEGREDAAAYSSPTHRYTDHEGRHFEPLPLFSFRDPKPKIAALLVFHVPSGPRNAPDKSLISEIADQLLEHGDVGAS
jgi:tetratricopeptide (TPR) repeat protein